MHGTSVRLAWVRLAWEALTLWVVRPQYTIIFVKTIYFDVYGTYYDNISMMLDITLRTGCCCTSRRLQG